MIRNAQVSASGVYSCTVTWPGGSLSTGPIELSVVEAVPSTSAIALLALIALIGVAIGKAIRASRSINE